VIWYPIFNRLLLFLYSVVTAVCDTRPRKGPSGPSRPVFRALVRNAPDLAPYLPV